MSGAAVAAVQAADHAAIASANDRPMPQRRTTFIAPPPRDFGPCKFVPGPSETAIRARSHQDRPPPACHAGRLLDARRDPLAFRGERLERQYLKTVADAVAPKVGHKPACHVLNRAQISP